MKDNFLIDNYNKATDKLNKGSIQRTDGKSICFDCAYKGRFGGCVLHMGEILNKISCSDYNHK